MKKCYPYGNFPEVKETQRYLLRINVFTKHSLNTRAAWKKIVPEMPLFHITWLETLRTALVCAVFKLVLDRRGGKDPFGKNNAMDKKLTVYFVVGERVRNIDGLTCSSHFLLRI